MKRYGILVVFLALAMLAQAGLTAGKEPYVVGAFFSVTGTNAPLGTPERDTVLMVAEQINKAGGINGHPLKLIVEDDASDPTNSVKAVKKLLEQDKVLAVVGGSGTGNAAAVVNLFAQARIPFLTCCAGTAGVTNPVIPWVFRTPQTSKVMLDRIIDYLQFAKIAKVGMIYDSNSYGTDGRDLLRAMAPKSGVTVVAEESFNSKDTDFTIQLTRVKDAGAQAIICWGTNPAPANLTRNRQQMGLTIPLIQSHGVANASYLQLSGSAAEGVVLPAGKLFVADSLPAADPQRKVLQQYAADFKARFNRDADTFGGHAWDGLQMIAEGLRKAGPDPGKLRAAIEGIKEFVGIGGVFAYSPTDHDGLTLDAVVLLRIDGGKFKLYQK